MYQNIFKLLFILISLVLLLVIPVSAVENFKISSYGAGYRMIRPTMRPWSHWPMAWT